MEAGQPDAQLDLLDSSNANRQQQSRNGPPTSPTRPVGGRALLGMVSFDVPLARIDAKGLG